MDNGSLLRGRRKSNRHGFQEGWTTEKKILQTNKNAAKGVFFKRKSSNKLK